jgi:signal transduction histidine kinase
VRWAVVVSSACVLVVVLTAVITVLGHPPLVPGDFARGLLAGLAYGLLGGVVAARRPELSLGWLMLLVGVSNALTVAADTWARVVLVSEPGSLPGGEWAYWLSTWTWVPGYAIPATLLLLLFPTGSAPTGRWRPLVWATAVVVVAATLAWALTPYEDQDVPPPAEFGDLSSPVSLEGAGVLLAVTLPLFVVCALLCLLSLLVRWRTATATERDQLRWVMVAAVVVIALLGVALALDTYVPGLVAVAMLLLPAAIAVAILRTGLWQLDVLLNRSLVYAGLTLVILGLYAAVVAVAGRALGTLTVDQKVAAVVLAAVAAQPLRDVLQRGVNRMLYGERDDPGAAVRRLADTLDDSSRGTDVLPAVVETVARTLRLPYVAIDTPGRPTVEYGTEAGSQVQVPLLYQGRHVGMLRASARAGETRIGSRELTLLADLSRHAAVASHAAALQEDLQRSREHLVVSREEERRRLRHDLHDDMGPALAATAMKLEAARDLVIAEPQRAIGLLDGAAETLRATVAGVRRIVDDLRPPSLDGLGLVGAFQEKLDQFDDARVELRLVVEPQVAELAGLPAAVDVAAYRIASEALTNALRHGVPTAVEVRLATHDRQLVVTVADDGAGLEPDVSAGIGFESMHTRAAEIGGTCTLTSRAGAGTTVVARLPLDVR